MTKSFINKFILVTCLLLLAFHVFAAGARVYFSAPLNFAVGADASVSLLADSDTPINAYLIELRYDPQTLEFLGADEANSIIDVWQKGHAAQGEIIAFEGGSLKPWSGNGGNLVNLRFKPLKDGGATIAVLNVSFYAADGKGTMVSPAAENITIPVAASASGASASRDKDAPEILEFLFVKNPYDPGQKILGFKVGDARSAVKDVFVRYRTWFFNTPWEKVELPPAIPADAWSASIRVVDGAGNVSERTIYDWGVFARKFSSLLAVCIMLLIIGAAIFKKRMVKLK